MKVTSKGQVTIPKQVRQDMGIQCAETEVEFIKDEAGRWILKKSKARTGKPSRFRSAHKIGRTRMTTEELMALTRGK